MKRIDLIRKIEEAGCMFVLAKHILKKLAN